VGKYGFIAIVCLAIMPTLRREAAERLPYLSGKPGTAGR